MHKVLNLVKQNLTRSVSSRFNGFFDTAAQDAMNLGFGGFLCAFQIIYLYGRCTSSVRGNWKNRSHVLSWSTKVSSLSVEGAKSDD
jgi:hypothetical protein